MLSLFIMVTYFTVQSLLVFDIIQYSKNLGYFGYGCFITFLFPFYIFAKGFIKNANQIKSNFNQSQKFIDKASIISKADANGKITYVNEKFTQVSGYSLEEVIGKDHNIVNSNKHPKEFWSNMYKTVVKDKQIWNEVVTNKAKNGEFYYVDTYIKADFDNETNKLLGFTSIRQDVTELKRKEQEVSNRINDMLEQEKFLDSSAIISKADAKGKITYVNQKFTDVSGYKLEEVLGKDHNIVNSGTHPKEFWSDMYKTVVKDKGIWNAICTNKAKDGSLYYVDTFIKCSFDNEGKLLEFMSIRQDVTGLKTKENEIRNRMTAINQSNAVIEFDLNGNIQFANSNFLNSMGYTKEDIVGKHHSIFVEDEFKESPEYEKFWETLRTGEFFNGEIVRKKKDGSLIYLQATYNPIIGIDGKPYRVMKIATDITANFNQQMEIEKKNTYLEHAAKILRHDMHSGINTYIPRGVSSLERRLTPEIIESAKLEAPLKMIKEGLRHTQKVYKGVYEFTNLVKTDVVLSKTECSIQKIMDDYLSATAYKSQVHLDDNLPTIEVNESLMCTSIDNLIRNGLKYNDSKSKLVKIYSEDGFICIEDNGRGINQKEFDELSKPYVRKEGQKETGSGLGLNICKAILKEHGFGITAEKLEQGTKLRIKIN